MRLSRVLIVLALVAGGIWWYWARTHPERVEVKVAAVERGAVESTVANTRAGTIKACRRALLSTSVGGQISELVFRESDRVKRGEVLLQLWNEDLRAELELAQRNIDAAVVKARAGCEHASEAQRSADRLRRLVQSGNVSEDRLDQAQTLAKVRRSECEAAGMSVSVAEAKMKVTEARLERTILRAPFDGVVAEINGELYEFVTPSPPGIQTRPVVDLIEPGCFYVSAPIDEVDASKVRIGQAVRITLDAWRGRDFDGVVRRIGAYVLDLEKQARTVEVEVQFSNAEDLTSLLAGYSADVDIILDIRTDVLRIPADALLDENHVLVFDAAEGVLEKRAVEKGESNWEYAEILSGLEAGEQVVTTFDREGVEAGAAASVDRASVDRDGEDD